VVDVKWQGLIEPPPVNPLGRSLQGFEAEMQAGYCTAVRKVAARECESAWES